MDSKWDQTRRDSGRVTLGCQGDNRKLRAEFGAYPMGRFHR